MSYVNKIGQTIEVGDIVTHTTASQYAHLNIGVVRGFHEERGYGTHPPTKVDVTWVTKDWRTGKPKSIKTAVRLPTVTKVDPLSLGADIIEALAGAK